MSSTRWTFWDWARRAPRIRSSDLDPEALDYVEQLEPIVDALVIAGDDKNRSSMKPRAPLIAGADRLPHTAEETTNSYRLQTSARRMPMPKNARIDPCGCVRIC